MLEVCPSFSCFINSLQVRHGRDPAPLPPSLLSLLCFVIAVARRRAKACWERTEEICWGCGMPDLARGPPNLGTAGASLALPPLTCRALLRVHQDGRLTSWGSWHAHPVRPPFPAVASAFPLRLFFAFVGVLGLTWPFVHVCLKCVCVCLQRGNAADRQTVADW